MPYYFAYGNNMRSATMVELCGPATPEVKDGGPAEVENWRDVGVARLRDHRLAFTVTTPNWNGPVGDVERRTGFFVYGFLYEVSDEALAALDGHEYAVGVSTLYERRTMKVERVDPNDLLRTPEVVEAQVYCVGKPDPEEPPEPRYLERLIEAATQRNLPPDYVRALRSLGRYDGAGQPDRAGPPHRSEQGERLLVLPTKKRGNRNTMPVIQLAPHLKRQLGLGRLAFVILEGRACLASVVKRPDLEPEGLACGIDETIRRGLRVPGIEPSQQFFGARVELRPAHRASQTWLDTRHFLLPVEKVEYLDAEREIVVVPELLLRMLGIELGDYLKIEVPSPSTKFASGFEVRCLRLRAFTGSTQRREVGGIAYEYPADGHVHLDLDGREQLGITTNGQPFPPALVSASVKHLILKRALRYRSLALIGVAIAISHYIMPEILRSIFGKEVGWGYNYAAGLGTALVLNAAAIWVDVSQRLRP